MTDSKQDVLDAFFADPARQSLTVHDLRGLGGAPRTLTAPQKKALDRLPPTRFALWLILALFFGLPTVAFVPMLDDVPLAALAQMFLLPGIFTALAVRSFLERKAARERYYRVFANGVLLIARVRTMFVQEYRAKLRSSFRHDLTFSLPNGKTAQLTTWDTSVDFLATGMECEALWSDELPDVIIPVQIMPQILPEG